MWDLCDEKRRIARTELEQCCRQHSVLSMYSHQPASNKSTNTRRIHLGIHWVQKARKTVPKGNWPSISEILRKEGITRKQLDGFRPETKPGSIPEWDVDLAKFRDTYTHAQWLPANRETACLSRYQLRSMEKKARIKL